MAYKKQSCQTPWIFRLLSWRHSLRMPTFSSTRTDAGFSGKAGGEDAMEVHFRKAHVQQLSCRFRRCTPAPVIGADQIPNLSLFRSVKYCGSAQADYFAGIPNLNRTSDRPPRRTGVLGNQIVKARLGLFDALAMRQKHVPHDVPVREKRMDRLQIGCLQRSEGDQSRCVEHGFGRSTGRP